MMEKYNQFKDIHKTIYNLEFQNEHRGKRIEELDEIVQHLQNQLDRAQAATLTLEQCFARIRELGGVEHDGIPNQEFIKNGWGTYLAGGEVCLYDYDIRMSGESALTLAQCLIHAAHEMEVFDE